MCVSSSSEPEKESIFAITIGPFTMQIVGNRNSALRRSIRAERQSCVLTSTRLCRGLITQEQGYSPGGPLCPLTSLKTSQYPRSSGPLLHLLNIEVQNAALWKLWPDTPVRAKSRYSNCAGLCASLPREIRHPSFLAIINKLNRKSLSLSIPTNFHGLVQFGGFSKHAWPVCFGPFRDSTVEFVDVRISQRCQVPRCLVTFAIETSMKGTEH